MAMGWLKGLVAPAAFAEGGGQQPYAPGGPPQGGAPSPYGVQPPAPAGGGPAPYDASGIPSPMQWSTGTRTQGAQGSTTSHATPTAGGDASLEARCAQLQHDVDSLALFARTLLTMLEENKVVSRAQFDATRQRLDMLDGKLDDR
jgi:hypothetical protein